MTNWLDCILISENVLVRHQIELKFDVAKIVKLKTDYWLNSISWNFI